MKNSDPVETPFISELNSKPAANNKSSHHGGYGIIKKIFFIISIALLIQGICTQLSAGPEMHGPKTVTAANVILNEFTTLTANAIAGATSISVASSSLNANGRFSGNLVAGELVMIIQMQGATINTANVNASSWGAVTAYNNAGKFEFNEVTGVPNGTAITLLYPLVNSYTQTGKVQVIRIPRYTSFHVNPSGSLITQPWNGNTGGVLAVEANGAAIINGTIDVSGMGFRGGVVDSSANSNHLIYASTLKDDGAEKGEGIAGDKFAYDLLGGRYGRGAPANGGGGGNSHNTGGGGGANAGSIAAWNGLGNPDTVTNTNWKIAWDLEGGNFHTNTSTGGGRGGYAYSMKNKNPLTTPPGNTTWNGDDRFNVGGWGGRPLNNSGNRIFFGGGGGAGDSNNNSGTGGANGGGIVYLLVGGTLTGNGTINANGSDGTNSTANDAAGGGGGGGSVVIFTRSGAPSNGAAINAKGGRGGNQQRINNSSGEAEGPGGGGAGGYISVTNPNTITMNVNGGLNGTTNSPTMVNFLPNGATMGAAGITANPSNPYSGDTPLPVSLKSFSGEVEGGFIELTWITSSEINNHFFTLEKSNDGHLFTVIASIEGSGNSTVGHTYVFNDKSPDAGSNYYRLSQTDYNGKSKLFNPVCVQFNLKANSFSILSVEPNPFSENLKIYFETEKPGAVQWRIMSVQVKVLKTGYTTAVKGINSFEFSDSNELNSGIYFIQLIQDDRVSKAIKIIRK